MNRAFENGLRSEKMFTEFQSLYKPNDSIVAFVDEFIAQNEARLGGSVILRTWNSEKQPLNNVLLVYEMNKTVLYVGLEIVIGGDLEATIGIDPKG